MSFDFWMNFFIVGREFGALHDARAAMLNAID